MARSTRCLRTAVIAIGAVAFFLLLLIPVMQWELLVMRELYTAAQETGLTPESASGAMQILGRYLYGPPPWVDRTVVFLSAWLGTGLLVAITILGHRFARFGTLRGGRRIRRLLLAVTLYALLVVLGEAHISRWTYSIILDLADAAGCRYAMISGNLVVGEGGPFMDGPGHMWFNRAWYWLPHALPYAPPFLVVFALDHRLTRRAQPRPGRCAKCGYDLTDNETGTCPECGAERS